MLVGLFLYIDFELLTHKMVTYPFIEDLLTLNQATKYRSDMLENLSLRRLSRIHNKLLSLLSEIRPQFQFPKSEQTVSEEKSGTKDNHFSMPLTTRMNRSGTYMKYQA